MGKFELYKDRGGKFRFRLKAKNGEIILASQGYASKPGAKNGIKSVKNHCKNVTNFKAKQTKSGHSFCVVARNGKVVGTSEVYKSSAACKNGIKSVRTNAPKAKVMAA